MLRVYRKNGRYVADSGRLEQGGHRQPVTVFTAAQYWAVAFPLQLQLNVSGGELIRAR
jgi:hypothetical protein